VRNGVAVKRSGGNSRLRGKGEDAHADQFPSLREVCEAEAGVASGTMSIVCGVIQHRRRSPLAKTSWSWPFGRIELEADQLRAYAPVFFGRFQLGIPYSDIAGGRTKRFRWVGRLRLSPRDGSGDVTIVTLNDGYLHIANVLRSKGIDVEDG
jgi:hypothetical protein